MANDHHILHFGNSIVDLDSGIVISEVKTEGEQVSLHAHNLQNGVSLVLCKLPKRIKLTDYYPLDIPDPSQS